MIIDVCLVSFKWMIVKRSVEIFDGFLELFVSVECQSSLVEDLGIIRLTLQGICKILDGFVELIYIYVNIAPFHQKILIFRLSLQSLIQIVQSSFKISH